MDLKRLIFLEKYTFFLKKSETPLKMIEKWKPRCPWKAEGLYFLKFELKFFLKYFMGALQAPENPLFYCFRGFWGAWSAPLKYFLKILNSIFIKYRPSAFQGYLGIHFTIILRGLFDFFKKMCVFSRKFRRFT